MSVHYKGSNRVSEVPSASVSKGRWFGALFLGIALWFLGLISSEVIPQVFLGMELKGATYALVGVIRAALGLAAVAIALRIAGLRLRDVGLVSTDWKQEALIGIGVATVFALVQFVVIIPNTGGASRSDVAANMAQIGDSIWGVFGFVVLAWAGAFSEELFFRGHFFTVLRNAFGKSTTAIVTAFIATVILFAAGHGYQGWAGIVDTGLYGGVILTLLYMWRGKLTACWVAHAMWNTIATVVLYSWI